MLEEIIENSFKDFHAKGLDYICLSRTRNRTRKLYFFNCELTKLPEVVNPHDHRYDFDTRVLAGRYLDFRYEKSDKGDYYDAFDFLTPLNGGCGFTWRGIEKLSLDKVSLVQRNGTYKSDHRYIHTIRPVDEGTVLLLDQWHDIVPEGEPTSCWSPHGNPYPDTSGLYSKFTPDELINRLAQLDEYIGSHFLRSLSVPATR